MKTSQVRLFACVLLLSTPIVLVSCVPQYIDATSGVDADFFQRVVDPEFSQPVPKEKVDHIRHVLSNEQFIETVAAAIKQDPNGASLQGTTDLVKWLTRHVALRIEPDPDQNQLFVLIRGGPFLKSEVSASDVELIMDVFALAIEERLKQDDIGAYRTRATVLVHPR